MTKARVLFLSTGVSLIAVLSTAALAQRAASALPKVEKTTVNAPVTLIDKDFRYALEVSGGAEKTPLIAAVHTVFQTGIDQGLGDLNMTSVAKLYAEDASTG